jgi:septum formation protein
MILEKLAAFNLILGSASPRRKELLTNAGFQFTIRTANTNEEAPAHLNGHETAIHIAREKANALRDALEERDLLITADTEVWFAQKRFGKPESLMHAQDMLKQLSGNSHEVISGVCFTTAGKAHCFTVSTEVTMRTLTDDEISYYLKNGNPLDKAGAYGIQEWIGLVGIARINGSYTNVVGLPMSALYQELENFIKTLNP